MATPDRLGAERLAEIRKHDGAYDTILGVCGRNSAEVHRHELLAERDAVLADNERLTAELAQARADFEHLTRQFEAFTEACRVLMVKIGQQQGGAERERDEAQQELAATRAKLDQLQQSIAKAQHEGVPTRPCFIATPHPSHSWMAARERLRCPGKGAQPPAVAAPDTATRATVTDPDETRDGAQRGQEGPWPPKVGTGTTQARESARTPSAAPDANEAGR